MDYRFSTLDEATALAMTYTPSATTEDRLMFRTWVWEAVKQIGPTLHWIKTANLVPKNGSFEKPKDLASTISIALYAGDTEVSYNYEPAGGRIHTNRYDIHENLVSTELVGRVDLSDDAYYFHLGDNGDMVTKMKIRYYALPLDRNGELLIPEDNLFATSMFCKWSWSMRKGDNQSEQMNARDTWYRELSSIKGRNKMPSRLRASEFFKSYASLINSYKPNTF